MNLLKTILFSLLLSTSCIVFAMEDTAKEFVNIALVDGEEATQTEDKIRAAADSENPLPTIQIPGAPQAEKEIAPKFSWRSFAQKHWLKIAGTAAIASYVSYYAACDRPALTHAYTWTKSYWTSVPKFFKPIIQLGTLGFVLNKTYNYFFKRPIIANSQNKFVTPEELEQVVGNLVRKADRTIAMQQFITNLTLKMMVSDPFMANDPEFSKMAQQMGIPLPAVSENNYTAPFVGAGGFGVPLNYQAPPVEAVD